MPRPNAVSDFEANVAPTTDAPPPKYGESPPEPARREPEPEPHPDGDEPEPPEVVQDRNGRVRPRHHARKDIARPEDVPRIRQLTKEKRELEKAHAEERAQWAKRLDSLEQAVRQPRAEPAKVDEPGDFTEPKPTIQSLIAKGVADPYAELPEAIADWRDKKAEHARKAESAKAKPAEAAQAEYRAKQAGYQARLAEFVKTAPDFGEKVKAADAEYGNLMTPVMDEAVLTDDNGPALVYYLAEHPEFYEMLFLQTRGQEVSKDAVAVVQRQLRRALQAVKEPDRPSRPRMERQPPAPPNPVRSSRETPRDDPAELLAQDHSLDTHMRVMAGVREANGYGFRRSR